jgi:hypothetical protein
MDERRFWDLIDLARSGSVTSADPDALRNVLDAQDDATVMAFGQRFHQLLCKLNTWRLWGAADVIGGGLSGDSFHYFRSWLIGKGRDAARVAQTDPDALGQFCGDEEEPENELLEYVAVEILEARGLDDPREGVDPDGEPAGEPPPEQPFEMHLLAMRERYPRLAAQFSAG